MISVIIPTFSRENLLEIAVKSIIQQNFPNNQYEILVIDNASTDSRKALIEKIIKIYPTSNVRYINESIPGLLSGRHRGVFEAIGELLVFIDEDVEADRGLLAAISNSFKKPNIHLVGGRCLPKYEIEPPKWLKYMWFKSIEMKHCGYLSLIDMGRREKRIDPYYVWGLNFSIRKAILIELGGFHPDSYPKHIQKFQGDGDGGLTLKLKEKGYEALYQPKALVYHYISSERMSVTYFEQRMFYQGVCNSYTKIRRNGGILMQKKEVPNQHILVSRHIKTFYRDPVLFLTKIVRKLRAMPLPKPEPSYMKSIKEKLVKAYNDGYNFHQYHVKNDPALLNWVLKEDYFDYRLPE